MPDCLKPFKAVIFDMDGVIVDSEPRHERAFLKLFDELGYADNHGVHFPDYYGKSDKVVFEDFIEKHSPPQAIGELLDRRHAHLVEILRTEQPVFDGLPEILEKARLHWPLAIASGSLHTVIDVVLAMKNLRQFFNVIVSSEDVSRGKPHPDIFLHTARLLKVEPADCVVIEDSDAGVTAANAAGMQCVGITNSFDRKRLNHATVVVDTYAELDKLLLGNSIGSG